MEIREMLGRYRVVAVVGLSRDPSKDSYRVASYLKSQGFKIVPINPTTTEILGETSYPSLLDMPENLRRTVQIVDIFRRAEDVPPIVEQAVKMRREHGHPHVIWRKRNFTITTGNEHGSCKKTVKKTHSSDSCLKIG